MTKIFISYRRDDSASAAGRIDDRLAQSYGRENVFKDVDSIPLGLDFRAVIRKEVDRCRVFLAVIGRDWLRITDASGGRRLDDPDDFVRLEIEAALQQGIPVIPVLVDGATMPLEDQLPRPLRKLAYCNGIEIQRDPRFHADVNRLMKSLDQLLQQESPKWEGEIPAKPVRSEPVRAAGDVVTNALGMKLAWLPAKTFWMGDRGSQKQVAIPADFYIGIYPVTQGQWLAIMGKNPSYFSRQGGGAASVEDISDADLLQFPVEQVNCEDINEFLKKLNDRERNNGLLYRLPTGAEWEYCCRGGATSEADCSFDFYLDQPTNDLSSARANFDGDYPAGNAPKGKDLQRTSKVGSYPTNRLGICDMHGNVWEWTADSEGSGRVVRGGSWLSDGSDCRASLRRRFAPSDRDGILGFRLAAVPSGEQAKRK